MIFLPSMNASKQEPITKSFQHSLLSITNGRIQLPFSQTIPIFAIYGKKSRLVMCAFLVLLAKGFFSIDKAREREGEAIKARRLKGEEKRRRGSKIEFRKEEGGEMARFTADSSIEQTNIAFPTGHIQSLMALESALHQNIIFV